MPAYGDYEDHIAKLVGKLLLSLGHTDVAKHPLEERERFNPLIPLPTRVILNTGEVWGHLLTVPPIPPATDVDIKVYQAWPAVAGDQGAWKLARRTDVAANKCWLATINGGLAGGEMDPRLENWVPAKYGPLWEVQLFDDAAGVPGAAIPPTHASGWVFDWQSGILTFDVDPTTVGIAATGLWIKGYRYVGPTCKDVIDSIAVGASITVEDSVPNPFPGTNIIRFGPNFTVTNLGGGRVEITMTAASTWPWAFRDLHVAAVPGVPGVPMDFALTNPLTMSGVNTFVFMEGVKLMHGAGKDYIYPNPNTLRLLNTAGRPIVQAGMEIEVFYG